VPDERVRDAIAHWAPRFVSQGVDFNDFQRVTSGLEAWPEWLPAWVENGDMHAALAREAEERGRTLSAGEAWNRAALSYHFAKFVWMVDMARYEDAQSKAVDAIANVHRLLDPSAQRIEIPYAGTQLVGNLRGPRDASLVLLLPGLDSTKEEFFSWENVFLRRGLATFSLDGPGQGETGLETDIEPRYERAVTAVLDHLDWGGSVGAAGVSLGGYYAPRAAAYEKRIRAAVGISGPYRFGDCWATMPKPTREAVQHHTGAPNEQEARDRASLLTLEEAAPLIDQPLLVITGRNDRLIPWEETKKIAEHAPDAEWVLYDEGNHVCNNIPYKYRPLTADWLREKLTA
jgi:pimeloyl-ACP methyl ester carboxylesterase